MLGTWQDYQRFRADFHAMIDPLLYTPGWLDGEVACGRFLLIAGKNSAILFSVKSYPTGFKEIQGEAAVGKQAEIVGDLIPRAMQYGKAIGCHAAQISSRAGWSKLLKSSGFEVYQTSIRKIF